jgi:hypothetical protein
MGDERGLWLAVLERAVIDLVNPDHCERYERPRLRYSAESWFRSNDYQPGTFLWVTDHLDLDASWLRRRLFAMIDASPVSTRPQFWHPPIIGLRCL